MVNLQNSGDSHRIKLDKYQREGEIRIHLDWSHRRSLWKRIIGDGEIDLDLGCYYKLTNGRKTLIDGLQFARGNGGPRNLSSRQGCYSHAPYIWHCGDDEGMKGLSGETIIVNPNGICEIERIIVYAFIYDGVNNWAHTNAVVRIVVPGNEAVEVQMGRKNSSQRFCAIAQLTFPDTDTIEVTKLVTFHEGHSDCDEAYGWGFNYYQKYK